MYDSVRIKNDSMAELFAGITDTSYQIIVHKIIALKLTIVC